MTQWTDRLTLRATSLMAIGMPLLFLLLLLGGCSKYHDVEAFLSDPEQLASPNPYTIGPPDMLSVLAPQVPEIDDTMVTVSPDGTIVLPLLGQVYVAGKTPEEVAALVEDRALEYYQEADVVVRVAAYRSKHVYVFGEVGRAGRFAYTGGDTLLDVLSVAQPTRLADGRRVQIYRPSPDHTEVARMTVELDDWYETGRLDRNALLEEGDIIYVPPHGLARVALTLQQVLLPIQPVASTIRAPNTLDESADVYDGNSSNSSNSN